MPYASILKSPGWDSKFGFSTTRDNPSALPYLAARKEGLFYGPVPQGAATKHAWGGYGIYQGVNKFDVLWISS